MNSDVKITHNVKEKTFLGTTLLVGTTILLPLVFQFIGFILMYSFVEIESAAEEIGGSFIFWGSILVAIFSAVLATNIIEKYLLPKAISLNKKIAILSFSIIFIIAITVTFFAVVGFAYYELTNV